MGGYSRASMQAIGPYHRCDNVECVWWQATELLYLKQTQLEAMAGEKAAAFLQLERQEGAARAESERARRREATQRASSTVVSADYDVVPMESLGGTYQKLANHQRVGHAVKAGAR